MSGGEFRRRLKLHLRNNLRFVDGNHQGVRKRFEDSVSPGLTFIQYRIKYIVWTPHPAPTYTSATPSAATSR